MVTVLLVLGLLQQLDGSRALAPFAARAWIGLGVAVAVAGVTYTLCYLRSLRKIVEEPDIQPSVRFHRWLPRFGSSRETAIVHFSIRTLLRSRQHRMLVAFYLGIGFAATVLLLKSPVAKEIMETGAGDAWHDVSSPMLAASIILMGFWVVGLRSAFALPMALPANWIFQLTPIAGSRGKCIRGVRRTLWILAVGPPWILSAAVMFSEWHWKPAAAHLVLLGLFGLLLTELCLNSARKIPFTCAWLPGKSNFHITFWICIMLILEVVLRAAEWERRVLSEPGWYAAIVVGLSCLVVTGIWWNGRSEAEVEFDEVPYWKLTTLDLPRV